MDEPSDGAEAKLAGNDLTRAQELRRRRAAAGGELGGLTISLMWDTRDDLDLYVITPAGDTINYGNRKSKCGGHLDVDANYTTKTDTPVENIFWEGEGPPQGLYKWFVRNAGVVPTSRGKSVKFTVQIQQGGVMKMEHGSVGPDQLQTGTSEVRYPETTSHESRLSTCKKCIESIVQDNCDEQRDSVGLVSFANTARWDSDIVALGGTNREAVLEKIHRLRTRGRTAYYKAILSGLKKLKNRARDEAKWLIALTDGADTEGGPQEIAECINLLEKTPNLNLALITLGSEADQSVLRRLQEAAKVEKQDNDGDSLGILLRADNLDQVREAFQSIAAEMESSGGAAG